MSDRPARKCNGGRTGQWCGREATVVCSSTLHSDTPIALIAAFPELDFSALGPLEWFACDDPRHQTYATATPIAEWFARNVPA